MDQTSHQSAKPGAPSVHRTNAAQGRLKKRYRIEAWFKACGMLAVGLACAALIWLLSSVVGKAVGGMTETYITLSVTFDKLFFLLWLDLPLFQPLFFPSF